LKIVSSFGKSPKFTWHIKLEALTVIEIDKSKSVSLMIIIERMISMTFFE
jgi:hypothetical protein